MGDAATWEIAGIRGVKECEMTQGRRRAVGNRPRAVPWRALLYNCSPEYFRFQIDNEDKIVSGRVMNISVKSEYALKAVFDLAVQYLNAPPGTVQMGPIKIADIAKRQKIPQKFLELILAGLKQSGFVDSRRGAEGGYLLARPADSITVGDVLRAVENVKGGSRVHANDAFGEVWRQVDQAISDVLDQTTFGGLARGWQAKQAHYVPNWDI